MIGNVDDARLALSGDVPVWNSDGTTRYVYLINDVIYKVAEWERDNISEYERYLWLSKTNTHPLIAFPNTGLFDVDGTPVIAMERIYGTLTGECYCAVTDEEHDETCMSVEMCNAFDLITNDNSGLNIILTDKGIYYLIDMAS